MSDIPKLSTIKTKVVAQNNRLKIALAAQAIGSPLVQLPLSRKALYISDPALIKTIWNDLLPEPEQDAFYALFGQNIISSPAMQTPWLPLLSELAQDTFLEKWVTKQNSAIDAAVTAWCQRKWPLLKPTLDATLLAHEIVFDTLFPFVFETTDPRFESALRNCLKHLVAYTNEAWIVSPYWPSPYRPFHRLSYKKYLPLIKQHVKNPTGYFKTLVEWNQENAKLSEHKFFDFILLAFLSTHQYLTNLFAATFYELASHKPLFLLSQKEIKTTLGQTPPHNDDFGKLPIATTLADEIFRLYPPVPWLSTKLKNTTTLDGTAVASGVYLYASPYALQRDIHVWPTGNNYDPAASFNDQTRREAAFMPFGLIPGHDALYVISHTALTFGITRLAQIADLSLPLTYQPLEDTGYFGVKRQGDMAVRLNS